MERQEIEQKIIKKMHEVWDLYKKYNPDGTFLSLVISKDKNTVTFYANNVYWAEDVGHEITAWNQKNENNA